MNYQNKEELLVEIKKSYHLFDQEFDTVPAEKFNLHIEEVDKTPQEMLAYQTGWLNLIMEWEQSELDGKLVITPSPEYKWNQLGLLYQSFYTKYAEHSLDELRLLFKNSVNAWCNWIELLTEEELFTPNMRKWTVTKANWPLWKWIHINSVAPFKNFRPKIRKWKKNIYTNI